METLAEFKRYVSYDPETGEFVRVDGSRAGCKHTDLSGKTYLRIMINGKRYRSHRLAWLFITGEMPENQIDHINGDGTDNRACNLRAVTQLENSKNQRLARNNTTGLSGVTWHSQVSKWLVRIGDNNKRKYLGLYETLLDAAAARFTAELMLGYHPNHGQNRPL